MPGPPVWIDAVAVGEDGDWHARLIRESISVPGEASDRLGSLICWGNYMPLAHVHLYAHGPEI